MGTNGVMQTYGRWPIAMEKGEGVYLYDTDGNQYLDFTAGIAVTALGHAHPDIARTLAEQAKKLLHTSNLFHIPQQIELANRLAKLSGLDKVFFCNSGAEAIEGAIKMARRYAYHTYGAAAVVEQDAAEPGVEQGVDGSATGVPLRHEIITFEHSFHGRTLAALSATCQSKYQEGFGPLVPGFHYAKPGDLDSVKALISETTCAILLEPLQGEGGVRPFEGAFLQALRELCNERGILLIFDEVQTGVGRTGTFFAYEQFDVTPDMVTLAKGLANGVPIGAVIAAQKIADVMVPGTHASTFGGNPLASAAALATLDVLFAEDVLANVREMGTYLTNRLNAVAEQFTVAKEVRGMGLLVGLTLDQPVSDVIKACMEKGLLLTIAGGDTIRFTPPLIITKAHIDEAICILTTVLQELYAEVAQPRT